MNKTGFKGQNPQRLARPYKIGVFDTETEGLNGRLLWLTYGHEDDPIIQESADPVDMFDYIFSMEPKLLKKTVWYAHNAEYDLRYLINYFERYKGKYYIQAVERCAGKFFQLNVMDVETDKKITCFRDSLALYPNTLKKFTQQFAPQFAKQDIGLDKGTVFDPLRADHREYARNDCMGLMEALKAFDALVYDTFGVHSKGTTASTAYQAMLRAIPKNVWHNRVGTEAEMFIRQCYYGGMVLLNAQVDHHYPEVTVFDINSSYPAQMRKGIPFGKPTLTFERDKDDRPAFYHVNVYCPDNVPYPVVPQRRKQGLSFPTGRFVTYISSIEMRYAEQFGYVFEVLKGYVFDGLDFPFNDFVTVCEKLRTEKKGTATEVVVKLMQNSVYGRFGMKPDGREVIITYDEPPEGYSALIVEESENCDVVPNAYYKTVVRDAEYMLPHYAAWITANARIDFRSHIECAGPESVVYGDTDGLHVIGEGVQKTLSGGRVGTAYGELKLEKTLHNAIYIAPKVYASDESITAKGVPKRVLDENPWLRELIKAGAQGDEFTYHSGSSLASFMRHGKLFVERRRKTTIRSNVYGHIVEDGHFRPRRANEPWEVSQFKPAANQSHLHAPSSLRIISKVSAKL